MSISNILSLEHIQLDVRARCKREVLQVLAEQVAEIADQDKQTIFDMLLDREKLGSTGVGDGVAIPHAKIDGLAKVTGALIRLEKPVDFDALDSNPVDLCFLLLAPSNATAAHLKALAKVARLLRDDETRDALRTADSAKSAHVIVTAHRKSDAA